MWTCSLKPTGPAADDADGTIEAFLASVADENPVEAPSGVQQFIQKLETSTSGAAAALSKAAAQDSPECDPSEALARDGCPGEVVGQDAHEGFIAKDVAPESEAIVHPCDSHRSSALLFAASSAEES